MTQEVEMLRWTAGWMLGQGLHVVAPPPDQTPDDVTGTRWRRSYWDISANDNSKVRNIAK